MQFIEFNKKHKLSKQTMPECALSLFVSAYKYPLLSTDEAYLITADLLQHRLRPVVRVLFSENYGLG